MMAKLQLHARSRRSLESLVAKQPQGILLHGTVGIDLTEVADWLAGRLTTKTAFATHIHPEKTGISIDQIRELYTLTRTKNHQPRVIVLHQTELMSHAAQTAFLKLLEEPTMLTTFVLLSHTPEALLPTIRSRIQPVEILPLNPAQTTALLAELGVTDSQLARQLRFIADGLSGELNLLVQDEVYRKAQFERAAQAKQLLQGGLLERLTVALTLSNDRPTAQQALALLARMLNVELARQPHSLPLTTKLESALAAIARLKANGSLKAQLLRFVLTS